MSVKRSIVFPQRMQDEAKDMQRLEQLIDTELKKAVGTQKESDFIEVEFDRMSSEGIDRYTDYVLGQLVEKYKRDGWEKVTHELESGNKKIKIWFI